MYRLFPDGSLPTGTYDIQRLSDALDADLGALDTIYDLVHPIKPAADKKLLRLRDLLVNEFAGKKVLLFTSYRDTARYLYRNINEDAEYAARLGGRRVRVIHGDTESDTRTRLVQAFAPRSNDRPDWAGTDKEVDILISTDVLSEGQNLQDCAYLVNYDLHWNPTRMIQRAGRIDRIGADFERLFVHNFFPDEGLEKLLGLVHALQDKIRAIDATIGLDASILGEAINPKVFNTLKRIEGEDATVIDEEEADAELASDEGLTHHLAEYVKMNGAEVLKRLPDGIHSGLQKAGCRGVFFYYQRRGDIPAETEHFWRFYDCATGDITDNRLVLAEMIRCKPDEPRVVDPDLKNQIHTIMAEIEESIVRSGEQQAMIETAPKTLSGDQNVVLVALQQLMGVPGVDRQRIMGVLGRLAQPLLSAPVKELKKALTQHLKDGNADAFVAACELVVHRYAETQPGPDRDAKEPSGNNLYIFGPRSRYVLNGH